MSLMMRLSLGKAAIEVDTLLDNCLDQVNPSSFNLSGLGGKIQFTCGWTHCCISSGQVISRLFKNVQVIP
jgi:hypothetical protein